MTCVLKFKYIFYRTSFKKLSSWHLNTMLNYYSAGSLCYEILVIAQTPDFCLSDVCSPVGEGSCCQIKEAP